MEPQTDPATGLNNPMYAPIPGPNEPSSVNLTLWRDTKGVLRYAVLCSCSPKYRADYTSSWDALMALNAHARQHAARLAQ
jgi:hypothetical protein